MVLSLLSASGTSQTPGDVRLESAKWAKADTDQIAVNNRDLSANLNRPGQHRGAGQAPGFWDKNISKVPAKYMSAGVGLAIVRWGLAPGGTRAQWAAAFMRTMKKNLKLFEDFKTTGQLSVHHGSRHCIRRTVNVRSLPLAAAA